MTTQKFFPEIELLNELVFKLCHLNIQHVEAESESQNYLAHTFQLDENLIKFRKAKITPTKTG